MSTKTNFRIISLALILSGSVLASPSFASAIEGRDPVEKTEATRAEVLMNRLETIRDMNKSEMTRMEKKSLRKEVKEINREMKATNGGIYLSVGAVIIIILLLILLL
jgi:hypothetical protein